MQQKEFILLWQIIAITPMMGSNPRSKDSQREVNFLVSFTSSTIKIYFNFRMNFWTFRTVAWWFTWDLCLI